MSTLRRPEATWNYSGAGKSQSLPPPLTTVSFSCLCLVMDSFGATTASLLLQTPPSVVVIACALQASVQMTGASLRSSTSRSTCSNKCGIDSDDATQVPGYQ